VKNPPAISDNADAAASWRAGNIEPPNPSPRLASIAKALAESWQNPPAWGLIPALATAIRTWDAKPGAA
jgi:hypothetical protein